MACQDCMAKLHRRVSLRIWKTNDKGSGWRSKPFLDPRTNPPNKLAIFWTEILPARYALVLPWQSLWAALVAPPKPDSLHWGQRCSEHSDPGCTCLEHLFHRFPVLTEESYCSASQRHMDARQQVRTLYNHSHFTTSDKTLCQHARRTARPSLRKCQSSSSAWRQHENKHRQDFTRHH